MSLDILFDENGYPSDTGTNTIYDLEILIIKSLNDFNIIYAQYLRCGDFPDTDRNAEVNKIMKENVYKRNCFSKPTVIEVEAKYNSLIGKIRSYERAFDHLKSISSSNSVDAQSKMAALEDEYKKLLKLRNELDNKTNEINKGNRSDFLDQKYKFDSTIYIQILMTILLISIIYYIFLHM